MTGRAKLGSRLILGLFLVGPVLLCLLPLPPPQLWEFVLFRLRLPRLLAGLLVGGTLGLAGATTQALFRNPLATPSTIGSMAGATLGALLAMVIGPWLGWTGLSLVTVLSFSGALATSLWVVALSASGRARTVDVLLVGIAVTLATTALATAIQDLADTAQLAAVSRWSLGHLAQIGFDAGLLAAVLLVPTWIALLGLSRPLQALALGEELASAQGVAVARVRAVALAAVALGVATVVAFAGPIVFVGLVVPQIVRLAWGAQLRVVLPGSLLAGAGFLVTCDALARLAMPQHEIPVGVITACLGAPLLAFLVASRNRGQGT